ncbi:MAG: HAD family hydrolase [Candidatus Sulfotelmatobacter sp.]
MATFRSAAILFDLDGVLVDSTRSVERQWRTWARWHGLDGDEIMKVSHGVRAIEIVRSVAPHLDAEAEVRKLERLEAGDHNSVSVMPGAIGLLRTIPQGRWCVVTSGSRSLATARLRLAGIPLPEAMVTADDVVNGKPHPGPYLKGAGLLGAQPRECLVIEDAPAGITSAHAARMKVIGIASTYPASALSEADSVVETLGQIRVSLDGARMLNVSVAPESSRTGDSESAQPIL